MARLMCLREASQLFLSHFSDPEIRRLIEFLERAGVPRSQMRPNFPTLGIFQNLSKLLFGTKEIRSGLFSTGLRWDLDPLIREIPRIKKMAAEGVLATKPEPAAEPATPPLSRPEQAAPNCTKLNRQEERKRVAKLRAETMPACPAGLKIVRDDIGEVLVSQHAWGRFFQRYSRQVGLKYPGWYAPEFFARKLQESFAAARKSSASIEMLITNIEKGRDPRRYRYFRDSRLGLRFVVSIDRHLVTIALRGS